MLLALGLVALAAATLSCGGGNDQEAERVLVHVGLATIDAELALTPGARIIGLGGRNELRHDAGMLFVLPAAGREAFWMKRMRFPLDFVWISADKRVVQVTEDVAPPEAGTADAALPLYQPDQPVRYVLEINAGVAPELGLSAGDAVTFEPEVDTARAE